MLNIKLIYSIVDNLFFQTDIFKHHLYMLVFVGFVLFCILCF